MEEEEWLQQASCMVCGALVVPAHDRAFALGEGQVMCFRCALARGGCYDENEDTWVVAPRLDDHAWLRFAPDSP